MIRRASAAANLRHDAASSPMAALHAVTLLRGQEPAAVVGEPVLREDVERLQELRPIAGREWRWRRAAIGVRSTATRWK